LQREIKSSQKLRTEVSADAEDESSDCNSAAGNCNRDCNELEDAKELKIAQLLEIRKDGSFAAAAATRGQKVEEQKMRALKIVEEWRMMISNCKRT
jgi:hypothetical protein